ncbi:ankyrin repeat and zinc finger domain-containing protein 1 [Aplysia californica]|uniref:Ankyrin repeat and zinc finger domain-containing protein 1 n=1 Tax=Aplysia californica TaxID=6500 RepID=A0ABM0JDD5_APLCA|nr:ankyrin repeat and zinc finger domain-containing protein 1 [Aplysia californica]
MEGSKSSPKRGTRSLTAHYSACLLHDAAIEEKLQGLTIASCNSGQGERNEHPGEPVTGGDQVPFLPEKLVVPDVMSCNCCKVSFTDREDQLSHYKSDWHRYNLHRRLTGQPFVTEDTFEEIAGDVSSISGSDEDDDDADAVLRETTNVIPHQDSGMDLTSSPIVNERKFHKIFFKNALGERISVYRCLLHHKKDPVTDPTELVKTVTKLPKQTKWIILMVSAGHFAGAVFHGKQVIEHKTFHRYTVRAKRGTAQSSRDKQGNAPKSAGARLRRYNEAALSQEIQELMSSWSEHLASCHLIFVRIPTNNRAMFYGGKNPILKKEDQRIRIIPFATRRPTFSEAKRVHQMLASVECYGQDADLGGIVPMSPPRFYSAESGQLEVREPREPKPKAKAPKPEPEKADRQESLSSSQHAVEPEEGSSSDADPDIVTDAQLVEHMQTVDFSHLRQFECTSKKKRGKKKKGVTKDNNAEAESAVLDEDRMKWRNRLFTACKTGDVDALLSALTAMKDSQTLKEKLTDSSPESCVTFEQQSLSDTSSTILSQGLQSSNSTSIASVEDSKNVENVDGETSLHPDKDATSPRDDGSSFDATQNSDITTDMLNSPVGDSKMTFLHLAAREGHAEIITTLLTSGADPTIKDGSGKLPYNVGETEVRNAFRRFMAAFPTRYDYAKAQVPSPLTPEMENEKKIKMAEKRKQKKKAAAERNKEKKAVEAQTRAENQEKERYLALSDREKRALAAERRILHQRNEQGKDRPVLSRCYQCGADITGKIPFEYSDYQFCTTKCLREHRGKAAS